MGFYIRSAIANGWFFHPCAVGDPRGRLLVRATPQLCNNGGAMSDTFKVAAVQMLSEPAVEANLVAARALIAEAARQGARLVSLPE